MKYNIHLVLTLKHRYPLVLFAICFLLSAFHSSSSFARQLPAHEQLSALIPSPTQYFHFSPAAKVAYPGVTHSDSSTSLPSNCTYVKSITEKNGWSTITHYHLLRPTYNQGEEVSIKTRAVSFKNFLLSRPPANNQIMCNDLVVAKVFQSYDPSKRDLSSRLIRRHPPAPNTSPEGQIVTLCSNGKQTIHGTPYQYLRERFSSIETEATDAFNQCKSELKANADSFRDFNDVYSQYSRAMGNIATDLLLNSVRSLGPYLLGKAPQLTNAMKNALSTTFKTGLDVLRSASSNERTHALLSPLKDEMSKELEKNLISGKSPILPAQTPAPLVSLLATLTVSEVIRHVTSQAGSSPEQASTFLERTFDQGADLLIGGLSAFASATFPVLGGILNTELNILKTQLITLGYGALHFLRTSNNVHCHRYQELFHRRTDLLLEESIRQSVLTCSEFANRMLNYYE